jgi:DNA repair protein RadA/Sms
LPSAASEKYARLYEFCRLCKAAGVTVFLVGHVTKKGQIAGPRDLEHNVDAVLVLRKVMDLRLLYVSKNRYGPEVLKGVPLVIEPVTTALRPSPHVEPVAGVARTFLGAGFGAGEMQAMVSLPSHNARPQIQAPGLPRRRVEQLLSCIAQVPGLEMEDLDLSIGCLMPGDAYFRPVFGLPLCMALISSYLRRPVPPKHLYVGEIDLTRTIRPLSSTLVADLSNSLAAGELGHRLRIVCPPCAVGQLPPGLPFEAVPCARLDDAIRATWPEIELH